MIRRIISTTLACFCFYLAYINYYKPTPTPLPKPIEPSPVVPVIPPKVEIKLEEVISLIKEDDCRKYIQELSSKEYNGRGTGTEGNKKAANYIKQHLESVGIPYKVQKFTARGKDTENIIGYIESKNKNNVIVIGAHFDHLGSKGDSFYPGADDNASGVAGVMAIATALSKYKDKLNSTILLQFYSAEEMGLLGSKHYVNNPLFPIDSPDIGSHVAMINLDMIGYLRKEYSENENTTTYRDYEQYEEVCFMSNIDLKQIVGKLSSKYSFANKISGYRPGGSDHAPFYNKGIPVVFLHTGTHSYYHTTSDTPDRLNYSGIEKVTRLAFEILVNADQSAL